MSREFGEMLLRLKEDRRGRVDLMHGEVTSITTGNLRVRFDGMPSGDVGPMRRAANYTPANGHRVLCVYNPHSKRWTVMFQVIDQP